MGSMAACILIVVRGLILVHEFGGPLIVSVHSVVLVVESRGVEIRTPSLPRTVTSWLNIFPIALTGRQQLRTACFCLRVPVARVMRIGLRSASRLLESFLRVVVLRLQDLCVVDAHVSGGMSIIMSSAHEMHSLAFAGPLKRK